jgi:hypothetical protein
MINYSSGMLNFLALLGSEAMAFANGRLKLIDGIMPVDSGGVAAADQALNGTVLCIISQNGGAVTGEVRAIGSIIVTAGTSGADSIQPKAGGIPLCAPVLCGANTALSAAAIIAAIYANIASLGFTALVDGGNSSKVNIYAPVGLGAGSNGLVVTAALTGSAAVTNANFAGGVTAINALSFIGPVAAGQLQAPIGQVWSGTNIATGTARYFRWESDIDDGSQSIVLRRIQGTVATSGADMNISSTTFAAGAQFTVTDKIFNV